MDDFKRSSRPSDRSDRPERPTPSDFRRKESGPGAGEKFPFKRSSAPFRKSGPDSPDSYRDRNFHSRSEGPPRFSKPTGGRRDSDKPDSYRDRGRDKKPFGKSTPDSRDSYRDREHSFHSRPGNPPGFSKPSRQRRDAKGPGPDSYRDRDKKPFGKSPDHSFRSRSEGLPSFSKKPRTRSDSDTNRDDRGKKTFDKTEQKSFVQSRVIKSGEFTKAIRTEEPKKDDGLTRLNKYIANSGVGSRREADELIKMGLIKVNGTTITELGTKVKRGDEVRYEDRVLKAEKPVYILLNKPKGFITTTDDPQERNTVMGLVAGACKERIYPVGRLDRNTTGLLLLTNDGDLADKLTHPSYNAKKVYKAELDRPLTKNDFQKIIDGIQLEEGRAVVDDLAIISDDHKTVGLEIHIGWNRVVRRIFETLGYEVGKLDRSVFAGLDKKDLSRGQWRFLKPEEVVRLKHFK
jgi:23S rRNA pseudouridine2605 synthase